MDAVKERAVTDSLRKLALWIKKGVDDGLSSGTIQPEDRLYNRIEVNEFEYTEQGVSKLSASGEHIYKKDWFRAAIRFEEVVRDSSEFACALDALGEILSDEGRRTFVLQHFALKLISEYLEGTILSESYVEGVITNLLKDIKGEPVRCGAEVELDGIVVISEDISFEVEGTKVILRKTRVEDIQKETPIYVVTMRPFAGGFSAILDIEFLSRSSNDIHSKLEQAMALLRLFRVGSVRWVTCRMRSESVTEAMGTMGPSWDKELSPEKSVIRDCDIAGLKRFWKGLAKALPTSFYENNGSGVKLNHLAIAYRRYCDALLQNGAIERRIANAVMGLESLFLKGSERQELSYRLKMRIAKILGIMGYDPLKISKQVGKAYEVRSQFVHGGHLSSEDRQKLQESLGDIRLCFILPLLDYLRVSLIIMILVKKGKEKLLQLIDDSFIDKGKDKQLNELSIFHSRYPISLFLQFNCGSAGWAYHDFAASYLIQRHFYLAVAIAVCVRTLNLDVSRIHYFACL